MMPPIRYRIQTIMKVIAALAVFMALLRLAFQADDTLILASIIVLIGQLTLYGLFFRTRQRRLARPRSFMQDSGQDAEPKSAELATSSARRRPHVLPFHGFRSILFLLAINIFAALILYYLRPALRSKRFLDWFDAIAAMFLVPGPAAIPLVLLPRRQKPDARK